MFENTYRSMNEQVSPGKALIAKTTRLVKGEAKTGELRAVQLWRRPLVAAAALLICTFSAMPALAANVPAIHDLLYAVSPSTAQFFIPVQESCEDNGIKMEVVSTYIHGDTAEILVTMQDITGDRIDETTDLYDSYSIRSPFDSYAHCRQVGYDEETKTATFLITITQFGGREIKGSKATFSVKCFLSEKREHEGVPVEIDLSRIGGAAKTKTVPVTGMSASGSGSDVDRLLGNNRAVVLEPSDSLYSPVEGIDVTGIGYVDGNLHIQIAVKNPLKNDNHGELYLVEANGSRTAYDYSVAFTEYAERGNQDSRVRYNEFVFSVPQSEIAGYALHGSFYTSGLYTEGKWQVTFPLITSGE